MQADLSKQARSGLLVGRSPPFHRHREGSSPFPHLASAFPQIAPPLQGVRFLGPHRPLHRAVSRPTPSLWWGTPDLLVWFGEYC